MSDLYATPIAQQYPHHPENGVAKLVGVVKSQGEKIREATSNLLRSAGIWVAPSGMTIKSSLTVEGDLAATGSTQIDGTLDVGAQTTIGGTLGVTGVTTLGAATSVTGELSVTGSATFSGDTEIGGNARITGTLSLPAGIIDNDALMNPIQFVDVFASDSGLNYSTSQTSLATCTLTVPAGFTKFTFSGAGIARCYNTSGATVYLYTQTRSKVVGRNTWSGATCQDTVANGFQSTVSAPHSVTHPIPPESTQVQVWVDVQTTASVAAHASNFVTVEGVAFFSR
ncbi:polymer-forming cytoskeletal protein [Cellulomonas cellasea]|uniref:polymer-forming cytoskeletal protein n=1 Tax=Cellulomonas cellasea TaxID=43670 RepID=UPI0025A36365|nr:polymer-forming cytoskeletal protein [Cellulomonas cellasea]MDM8084755.1 polymer-forming cytoskeletal protein [Cellulomonas cellasea]